MDEERPASVLNNPAEPRQGEHHSTTTASSAYAHELVSRSTVVSSQKQPHGRPTDISFHPSITVSGPNEANAALAQRNGQHQYPQPPLFQTSHNDETDIEPRTLVGNMMESANEDVDSVKRRDHASNHSSNDQAMSSDMENTSGSSGTSETKTAPSQHDSRDRSMIRNRLRSQYKVPGPQRYARGADEETRRKRRIVQNRLSGSVNRELARKKLCQMERDAQHLEEKQTFLQLELDRLTAYERRLESNMQTNANSAPAAAQSGPQQ